MVRPALSGSSSQNGNILVYLLIGILLIGLLTVAIRQGGDSGSDIDRERLAIKATEVQRYAAQIQAAVSHVIQSGVSETDLRFAHPKAAANYGTITVNPSYQVFHPEGGNADYKLPPVGVQDTQAPWEFFAQSDIPQIGSDKADLIMVLPYVTLEFCQVIDKQLGFGTTIPNDPAAGSPSCIYSPTAADRFAGTFNATPNLPDSTTFTRLPAAQGCISCAGLGTSYHYYYVLLAR